MTSHRLQTRAALAMMKKINILSPSTTDVSNFIEYHASTKGDIDACTKLLLRSKLRRAEATVDAQKQQIETNAQHSKQMEAVQAQQRFGDEDIHEEVTPD